ncbi:MAG: hypothetical protein AB1758_12315 [Candidatus Eremiobacterota bacterium]
MTRKLLTLIALAVCLTGCLANNDGTNLPKYKDPSIKYLTGNSEVRKQADHTLYIRAYRSLDGIDTVAAWYKTQLSSHPELKGPYLQPADKLVWTDGNIQFIENQMNDFKPKDPKKPGCMVLLDRFKDAAASSEGYTVIYLVRSEPTR